MIRLTVLYNLPAGADEAEYLAWRRASHADYVNGMPGVLRSDFARVESTSPSSGVPAYRFQTTVDWPDYDSYAAAFLNEQAQADLKKNLERLGDYLFVVSEILND